MSDSNLKDNLEQFAQGLKGVIGNGDKSKLQKLYSLLENANKPADEKLAARLANLKSDFLNWTMGTPERDVLKNGRYFAREAHNLRVCVC